MIKWYTTYKGYRVFEIIFLLIVFFILSSILFYSIKTSISPMFSSPKVTKFFNKIVEDSENETIVDLGSGWGTLAFYIALKNPNKTVIGYELSPIPFYFAKFNAFILGVKNLHFYKEDFLDIEFNEEYLYLSYLCPEVMDGIEKKIKKDEIRINLVSSTFAMRGIEWDKKEVLNDVFRTPFYFY